MRQADGCLIAWRVESTHDHTIYCPQQDGCYLAYVSSTPILPGSTAAVHPNCRACILRAPHGTSFLHRCLVDQSSCPRFSQAASKIRDACPHVCFRCPESMLMVFRAEFARKNLPQAEMLYSKAVEIKAEDATLHRCVCVAHRFTPSSTRTRERGRIKTRAIVPRKLSRIVRRYTA